MKYWIDSRLQTEAEGMDNTRTSGFGMGHLESLKSKAAYMLKDSFKIARLALVDVSTAELMTEEATNADEWGPTTKQMAEISRSIKNSEDYLRIVHVLHKRFTLNTQKFWRQIHKSLILLEYLLCHGPEHLVVEFRQDKARIEEFTSFACSDSNGRDRASVLQRRAKHVLHILMDESFYKKERTRAQRISSGISGYGSASLQHHHHQQASRSEFLRSAVLPRSQSAYSFSESGGRAGDSTSLLLQGENDDQFNGEPDVGESCRSVQSLDSDCFSPSTSTSETSSWRTFSGSSTVGSLTTSGRSTCSTCGDVSTNEESLADISPFPKTAKILNMDSVASEIDKNSRAPTLLRLPPPPPVAGYKGVMPREFRVRSKQHPESGKRGYVNAPDLVSI